MRVWLYCDMPLSRGYPKVGDLAAHFSPSTWKGLQQIGGQVGAFPFWAEWYPRSPSRGAFSFYEACSKAVGFRHLTRILLDNFNKPPLQGWPQYGPLHKKLATMLCAFLTHAHQPLAPPPKLWIARRDFFGLDVASESDLVNTMVVCTLDRNSITDGDGVALEGRLFLFMPTSPLRFL